MSGRFKDHFEDWFALQPKRTERIPALKAYYRIQDNRRNSLNQSATLAGLAATWAWREIRKALGKNWELKEKP